MLVRLVACRRTQDPGFNAFGFTISVTGTYSIAMNSNTFNTAPTTNDGVFFVFPTFDPANPTTNLIARGDGPSTCRVVHLVLAAPVSIY